MGRQLSFIKDESEIFGSSRSRTIKRSLRTTTDKVYDCSTCGLDKLCKKPKIKRFGKGQKDILIVGLCPGRVEDKYGIPLIGPSGDFAKDKFKLVDVDLDIDCVRTNVISCYPGKDSKGRDKKPTEQQIKCCTSNLLRDIEEVKPKMIICLGTEAIQAVLRTTAISSPNVTTIHGKVFPYHKLNCWVGCLHHPSFFLHKNNNEDGVIDDVIFAYDLANIIGVLDKPLPQPLSLNGNILVQNVDEAVNILNEFSKSLKPTAFDYETTSVSSFDENSEIVMVSVTDDPSYSYCIPLAVKNPVFNNDEINRIYDAIRGFITSDAPKVIQNFNMEEMWSRKILGVSINNFIHDTMVSYHVINGRVGCNGLEFQAFEMTGHEYKDVVDIKNAKDAPINDLCTRCGFDSRYTIMAYYNQIHQLKFDEKVSGFNRLFTESLLTLTNLKDRGIPIDKSVLNDLESSYTKESIEYENEIRKDEKIKEFEDEKKSTTTGIIEGLLPDDVKSKDKFNPDAPIQWGKILYGKYGIEPPIKTKTSLGSTSDESLKLILESTDNEKVKGLLSKLFEYRQCADILKKIAEYRRSIHGDGKIHPTFNLHTTPTYRSSANGPNSQNPYKHNKKLMRFRKCYTPEPGYLLLEGDYKAQEIRVIGMMSGDKELIRQIIEGIDMHKKYASKLFEKSIDEVTSDEKYSAKNGFVFPSIYGSKPDAISKYHIKLPVDHIQKIQDELWDEFHGVREWQLRTIAFYNENGYVEGLSGCKMHGPLTIYQIYNYPIQGPSFHLLLDALNRIDKFMVENGFRSKIINEVHDADLTSTHPDEIDDVIDISNEIMISQRFDWQTVPLQVSWSMGENWYEMEDI
jgi:uracil-DNA glycosylase family 4